MNDTEIEPAIGSNERHFVTDDHQNCHIVRFPGLGPFAYLRTKRLFTPSIWRPRVASDLQAILRICQNDFRFVGFPVWPQSLIDQPDTVKGPTLGWPLRVALTATSNLAVLAPRPCRLLQFFDSLHLPPVVAISACFLRARRPGRGGFRLFTNTPTQQVRNT